MAKGCPKRGMFGNFTKKDYNIDPACGNLKKPM